MVLAVPDFPRNKTAIVGIGSTPMVRHRDERLNVVAAEAARAAADDAGINLDQIDGYFGNPGAPNCSAVHVDGVDEVSAGLMIDFLGLKNVVWASDSRGLPTVGVAHAVQALASGVCSYALVLRAMYNPSGVRYSESNVSRVSG